MAATSKKGSLPHGWVVKTSKKYPDRIYYFNLATGASTWECPELDPPRLLEVKEEFESKHTSILNQSFKKEPEDVGGCTQSQASTAENLRSASEKLMKAIESNNLTASAQKNSLTLPVTRTLETNHSAIDASRKSLPAPLKLSLSVPLKLSLPVPLKLPLLPLPDTMPSLNVSAYKTHAGKGLLPTPDPSEMLVIGKHASLKRKLKSSEPLADANPPTAVVAPVVSASLCATSLPANHNKVKFQCKSKRQMRKQNALNKKIQVKEIKQFLSEQRNLSSGSGLSKKSSPPVSGELGRVNKKMKGQPSQCSSNASSNQSYGPDLDLFSEVQEPSSRLSTGGASTSMLNEIQNSSCEDIEMLDVSADLTKIDDLAVSAQITDDLCSYYIVIDTNVLIEDLSSINEMKDTPLGDCGPPHIFIPWIVIQELDTLKRSTRACGTGRAAQQAVRYLNKVLKSKHPHFHGQSPQEAEDCAKSYSKCNDDKILECCMSLAQKMPPEKVVLITHDKNLINKALICGIVVHSWGSLKEAVKPKAIKGKSKKKRRKKNKNLPAILAETPEVNEKNLIKEEDVCKAEIHTIMSEARQLLKDVLELFLIEEMNEAYGDPWNAFPINRQLLNGILDAISKYWRTVFAFHFVDKDKRNFELLREKVSRPEGFLGDREDCLSTLTAIEDVFCRIKRRWPKLEIPIENVEDLRLKCNDTFTKYNGVNVSITQIQSAMNLSESDSVLQAFENAWTVINHLCGMVMDFYQIQHNFVYEKPDSIPSEADFRNLMINLYPAVQNIKKLMSGVVGAIKNHNPRSQIFEELYRALTDLVPTLQIQANNPSVPNFNPKALEWFCRNPENTERVQLGFKQIEHFFAKLDQAVKVMASCKDRSQDSMALD